MEFEKLLDELVPEVVIDGVDGEPTPLLVEIGSAIRKYRKERHISQKILSQKSGVSQANISKFENGRCNFSLLQVDKLLAALEASMVLEVVPNE